MGLIPFARTFVRFPTARFHNSYIQSPWPSAIGTVMSDVRRVLVALVALLTLALVAPWGAPKGVADGDRLECGTYCQSAHWREGPLAPSKVA